MVRRRRVLVRVRRRRVAGVPGADGKPSDLPTRRSPGSPQVRKSSTSRPVGGRLPDLNVRKPSGNRPVGGRPPDGFRTLDSYPLHSLPPDPPQQCPETVRKSSGRWTVSGRFPDIEVRKSSTWRTGSGRLPDLRRAGRSPGREIAVPQARRRRVQRHPFPVGF